MQLNLRTECMFYHITFPPIFVPRYLRQHVPCYFRRPETKTSQQTRPWLLDVAMWPQSSSDSFLLAMRQTQAQNLANGTWWPENEINAKHIDIADGSISSRLRYRISNDSFFLLIKVGCSLTESDVNHERQTPCFQ